MWKKFRVTAVFTALSFFAVVNLNAQSFPAANETELLSAIANVEENISITNQNFELTAPVFITDFEDLNIFAASETVFHANSSGDIFNIQNSEVKFENIGFKDASGSLFMRAGGSDVNFTNAVFENNSGNAADNSAFVFEERSNITFGGQTEFRSNAGYYGGGFYSYSSAVTFNDKTVFENNEAQSGGALYADSLIDFDLDPVEIVGSAITFNGETEFISNKAGEASGGAFAINGNSSMKFNGASLFKDNSAATDGGAGIVSSSDVDFDGFASFEKNKAGGNGGALYAASNFANNLNLSAGSEFINNEAGNDGGAVYLHESVMNIQNSSFINNKAGRNGGAVFVKGDSEYAGYSILNINTVNNGSGDNATVFQGNTAGGESNALYLDAFSEVTFNTASGAFVEMYDGIKSVADTAFLKVAGLGDFNMYADAELYNLELEAGNFNLSGSNKVDIVNFTADKNSVLNMQNASHFNSLSAANFDFDGALKIDGGSGEGDDGDRIIAVTANLGANSKLDIKTDAAVDASMSYRKRYYRVLNYQVLTGSFSAVTLNSGISLSSLSVANEISYAGNWLTIALTGNGISTNFSSISGLSYNQQQTAKTFDRISSRSEISLDLDEQISAIDAYVGDSLKREALLDSSGYFLANVIRSAAMNGDRQDIYSRIRFQDLDSHNLNGIWVQGRVRSGEIFGDENSQNKYTDFETGALAGWDIVFDEHGYALGVYGKYNKHNIEQSTKNEAVIEEFGAGVYGGILRDEWEIKALISGSADNFTTARYINFADRKAEAGFSGMTLCADLEGAIRSYITEYVLLRPFAGIGIKNTSYDSFNEENAGDLALYVNSGDYSRSAARIGLSVGSDEDVTLEWYANVEGKYLLTSDTPEITASFVASQEDEFNSAGAKEGSTVIGFGAGCAYRISDNLKVSANASYQSAENYYNIYGNLGIRYLFK